MIYETETKNSIEIHDRPGTYWSDEQKITYRTDLRALGSECLSPLPEYQCFSNAGDAFDDKLLLIIRDHKSRMIAFASALFLDVPGIGLVLHTGLTCVAPTERQTGLTMVLFYKAVSYMMDRYPKGFWITNLAEVTSSLVNIGRFANQVYPSPYTSQPSATHLAIAANISANQRAKMMISNDACFDAGCFVFRASNSYGSPFRKDIEDSMFHHRDENETNFYKALFRRNCGDEVLQVGYLNPELITVGPRSERFRRFQTMSMVRSHCLSPSPYCIG